MNEKILVIKKTEIPSEWLQDEIYLSISEEEFLNKINNIEKLFIDRKTAEHDNEYKQIIPYVILYNKNSDLIACYQRKGNEKRLDGKWSLGFGGHINKIDHADEDWKSIIINGLVREMEEELIFNDFNFKNKIEFLGIINEEKTKVGNVHIGLVYKIEVDNKKNIEPKEEISEIFWYKEDEIEEKNFELWSILAIKLLKKKKK